MQYVYKIVERGPVGEIKATAITPFETLRIKNSNIEKTCRIGTPAPSGAGIKQKLQELM